jgi:hypothetical protein
MTPHRLQRRKGNAGVDDDRRTRGETAGVMQRPKSAQPQRRDRQATPPQATLPAGQDWTHAREPSRSQDVSQGATRRDKIRLIPHRGNGCRGQVSLVEAAGGG